MPRIPTIVWLLTIAECAGGYWLITADWRATGGAVIGSACAFMWARIKPVRPLS